MPQMSYLRNRLNYYSEEIDFEFYDKNKEEFDKTIVILKKLIKGNNRYFYPNKTFSHKVPFKNKLPALLM